MSIIVRQNVRLNFEIFRASPLSRFAKKFTLRVVSPFGKKVSTVSKILPHRSFHHSPNVWCATSKSCFAKKMLRKFFLIFPLSDLGACRRVSHVASRHRVVPGHHNHAPRTRNFTFHPLSLLTKNCAQFSKFCLAENFCAVFKALSHRSLLPSLSEGDPSADGRAGHCGADGRASHCTLPTRAHRRPRAGRRRVDSDGSPRSSGSSINR